MIACEVRGLQGGGLVMRKSFHFVAIVCGCYLIAGQPTAASLKVMALALKAPKKALQSLIWHQTLGL